jgi:aryl-alcohol dehydrogenase-like predicted oxidoreductase
VLTGKYLPGSPPPADSRATDDVGGGSFWVKRWLRDEVLEAVQLLRPIAEEAGLTMGQLAIAWVLTNDNIASAIVGASRPQQIADNVAAVGHRLDADTMAAVDAVVGSVANADADQTDKMSPEKRP